MAQEIETKVLDIDASEVEKKLLEIGAKEVQRTTLRVDWYRPKGTKEGEDPWFLRMRSDDGGKYEVTWKAKSDILGTSRRQKEINFFVEQSDKLAELFVVLGLERYAHQDKLRTSFALKGWRFEIDQYPKMPPFLEIEGDSEKNINEAIALLGLEANKTWAKGERMLIQEVYGLDWYDMKF